MACSRTTDSRRLVSVFLVPAFLDAQPVVHVLHAPLAVHQILGQSLGPPIRDGPLEGDLSALDRDFDLRRVELLVLLEVLVDGLPDPIVRSLVSLRSPSGMRPASEPSGV